MAFQAMIDGGVKKQKRKNKALIDEISATLILQGYGFYKDSFVLIDKIYLIELTVVFLQSKNLNMILPIVAYGDPVLRKKLTINADYPNLRAFIDNMYETMYGAYGVGLAAPQVGVPIRVFLVDASPFSENEGLGS